MSATLAPLVPALDDAARRGTGCLNVTGPQAGQQAQIFFDDGLVYAVQIDTFTPIIGRRLLTSGALTSDQYATLLARANGNEHDHALGVQAVKAGYFRQDVLDDVLTQVLAAAFMDVLTWPTPSTRWKRRARTTHLSAPPTQITTLLQSARRTTAQWQARWAAIGLDPASVRPFASDDQRDSDPDGVSHLLAAADGTLDLRTISQRCGLTYFEAGLTFLDLYDDGIVTFTAPTMDLQKDPAMPPAMSPAAHSAIPVTHVAPAVDSVPGLPLPPLPNFDGQTLPPAPELAAPEVEPGLDAGAAVADVPEAHASGSVAGSVAGGEQQPMAALPLAMPASQRLVVVEFDTAEAAVALSDAPSDVSLGATPDASPSEAPVESPIQPGTEETPSGEAPEEADSAVEIASVEQVEALDAPADVDPDPRTAAQRALLADELDAAAEAVRFTEATITRLAAEEKAHQSAADQALAQQRRYESFLAAAASEENRLLAEQEAAASEAAALADVTEELTASHAALTQTLAEVEEAAAVAQRALDEAQRNHDAAMTALTQAREATVEVSTRLTDMNAAVEENRDLSARLVEDLDVVKVRSSTYAVEIDEARQSAVDLTEAAQASARLRERAEQRLAAVQANLSSKTAELDG